MGMIVVIFAVATLLYTVRMGDTLRYPDEVDYLRLARNLAVTGQYTLDGTTPTAYRPTAYPLLLGAGLKLGLSVTALRVANASTLFACMALLYLLVRKTSTVQANIAVLLIISYPVLVYTAGTFYPQIPAAALFLSAVFVLFSTPNPRTPRFVFAGALLGITILMVPTFAFTLLFTPVFFAWRSSCRTWIRTVSATALGAALILTPWIARNAHVFGRFVPISTNNGISLLTGNNEHATSNSGVTADLAQHLSKTTALNEIEADAYYRRVAIDFMRTHPCKAFILYLAKTGNYYNYHNTLAVQSESSATRDLIMLITYGFLLAAATTRIFLWPRYPLSKLERFTLYLYVLNGFFSAIFFTRVRFRLPMDILLIVLASATLAITAHQIANQKRRTAPPPSLPSHR